MAGPKALLAAPLLLAVLLAAAATARGQKAPSEDDAKAALLYNFSKFVEWPAGAFQDDRSSLRLCLLGADPFGGSLQALAGEEVAGRKLILLRSRMIDDPAGCHVLFISRSEQERLPRILAAVRDAPVLTVGDTQGFLERGGIVNFVLEGSRVRFEISQAAAERVRIKISSHLLRLATRVVAGEGPGG